METKTPLSVTQIQSATDSDYVDLTLANGMRARIMKSKLFPIVTENNDGLESHSYAKSFFRAAIQVTGYVKVFTLKTTVNPLTADKLSLLFTASENVGFDMLFHISAYYRAGIGSVRIKNLSGDLNLNVKFYIQNDEVAGELKLYALCDGMDYIRLSSSPLLNLYTVADAVNYELVEEEVNEANITQVVVE